MREEWKFKGRIKEKMIELKDIVSREKGLRRNLIKMDEMIKGKKENMRKCEIEVGGKV